MLDTTGVRSVYVSQSPGLYVVPAASMQKVEEVFVVHDGHPDGFTGVRRGGGSFPGPNYGSSASWRAERFR